MKRLSLACAAGALLFLAPSCAPAEAATAAGTYEIDAAAMAKSMAPPGTDVTADMLKKLSEGIQGSTILNADNTFSSSMKMSMMGMAAQSSTNKGTYTIKDGAVTFTQTHMDGKEKKDTATGTLKDGVLTVTVKKGDKEQTMSFKKKAAAKK